MMTLPANLPKGRTIIRRTFTWQEWCQAAEANGPRDGYNPTDRDWTGGADYHEALAMAKGEGWQEAVADVGELVKVVKQIVTDRMNTKRQRYYDVAGGRVDVPRFLAGDPACMVHHKRRKVMRTGKVLKVVVPTATSAGVDADIYKRRGAAVMALIECFSLMQHTIEVWADQAVSAGYGDKAKRQSYMIQVQRADQPLDMGRVMFALAHPAMFRQLGFAVNCQEDNQTRNKFGFRRSGGYGSPSFAVDLEDADINPENAIILPELRLGQRWDIEYSVNWIKEQLARIEENAR